MFIVMQLVGSGRRLGLIRYLYPVTAGDGGEPVIERPDGAVRVRSQRRAIPDGGRMARATCRRRVAVRSAGTEPADKINPAAVAAMAEVGIDISRRASPNRWTDEIVRAADVVITMGCGDTCPSFPASATKTGSSTTPPAETSAPCERSATRSETGSKP